MALKKIIILLVFLQLVSTAAAAAEYSTTYTINVRNDGTAIWYVEYRTPLVTKADFDAFENYTVQLKPVYLNQFKELMQNSVSAASNATSRKMTAGGFSGEAEIQKAPTGNYGVVLYSFTWTDFAKLDRDGNIIAGDVFNGGLYLSKDNALIIQYPSGYTVEQVTPPPDLVRDGMTWYGLRTFNAGEPVIRLKPPFSWIPYALLAVILAAAGGAVFLKYRKKDRVTAVPSGTDTVTAEAPVLPVTTTDVSTTNNAADMRDLEERILALLKESGGALYQSDIVKKLDIPKSTVSSALNELHEKKMIQKIKKGRENLIRLEQASEKS